VDIGFLIRTRGSVHPITGERSSELGGRTDGGERASVPAGAAAAVRVPRTGGRLSKRRAASRELGKSSWML
jgi:hypothetical protein